MPLLKKKPKAAAAAQIPWSVGDSVQFDNAGDTIIGDVTEVNDADNTVEVTTAKGEAYDVPVDLVEAYEEPPARVTKVSRPGSKAAPVSKRVDREAVTGKGKVKRSNGAGKGSSLADAFNEAKAAARGGGLPEGKHEAILVSAEIEAKDKGTFVYFDYVLVNEDDAEQNGMTGRASYMLLDEDGAVAQGMEYFKRDLSLLGKGEVQFNSDDEVAEMLSELGNEELWVSINVKENTRGYSTIYLNGAMENQEDKPETPAF